mgnify:CR=1 FL=1
MVDISYFIFPCMKTMCFSFVSDLIARSHPEQQPLLHKLTDTRQPYLPNLADLAELRKVLSLRHRPTANLRTMPRVDMI